MFAAESFQDCDTCPEMIVLPAGSFTMGEPPPVGDPPTGWGGPPVEISIDRPFAMARTEITVAQFRAFVSETGHTVTGECRSIWEGDVPTWQKPGWPDAHTEPERHPVVCVGFEDALAYVGWLNGKTGGQRRYDLPSEARFEYALRAGDPAPLPWPDADTACGVANVADVRFARTSQRLPTLPCDDGFASTSPVASFPPNRFGLYDLAGNVWEWTLDCSAADYETLPRDGTARQGPLEACTGRQTRGGSFVSSGPWLNYSARGGLHAVPETHHVALGFRVVAFELPHAP